MNHILAITALLVSALDLMIKLLPGLKAGVLIPGILGTTYAQNTGVAFGLFTGQAVVMLLVSALVTLLGSILVSRLQLTKFEGFALGLMLGGAVGNIIDRALHGAVTDYLEFLFFRFPVFNLADAALTCGAGLLIIYWLLLKKGSLN